MLASNWVYRLLKETFDNLETKSCVQAALLLGFALVLASAPCTFGQVASQLAVPKTAPKTWIDPDTGHRITRLSDTPNAKAIYFNQNSHTPDGKDMIYISPRGIHVVNMSTFETKLLVRCVLQNVVVGTQTRRVFFTKAGDGQHIFTVDIDTQQVTKLPVALPTGAFLTSVNADETLLGGYYASLGTLNYQGYEMQGRQELLNEKKNAPAAPGSSSNESARDLLHAENAKIKAKATELRFAAHTPQYIFTEE